MSRFSFKVVAKLLLAAQFFPVVAKAAPAQDNSTSVFYAEVYKTTPVPKDTSPNACVPESPDSDDSSEVCAPEFIETKTVYSSPGFDPNEADTAASHIKLLSALVVLRYMKQNPEFKDEINSVYQCTYGELLRRMLISSYNGPAQEFLRRISDGTDDGVRKLLKDEGQALGLSAEFHADNAAGDPDYPVVDGRADSKATAIDRMKILHALGEYRDWLINIYSTAGTVYTDSPTLNMFYPIIQLGDSRDGKNWAACKTGTDRKQKLSVACHEEIVTDNATFVIDFYQRNPKSYGQPIRAAAQSMLKVMDQAGVASNDIRHRYEDIASGKIAGNYVGAPAGFLWSRQEWFILPVTATGPILASSSPKIHQRRTKWQILMAKSQQVPKSHSQTVKVSSAAKRPATIPGRPHPATMVFTPPQPHASGPPQR